MPTIDTSTAQLSSLSTECVAILALRVGGAVHVAEDAPVSADQLAAVAFEAKRDETVRLPAPADWTARSVLVVGLGSDTPDAASLRYAAGVAARKSVGMESLTIAFPLGDEPESALAAIAEGAALGGYDYRAYRGTGESKDAKTVAERIVVHIPEDTDPTESLQRASVVAAAVETVRDLVNEIPLTLYPDSFAKTVTAKVEGLPISVEVWDEERLRADGFGGILGVGQGSTRPPRLVKLSYSPADAQRHLALVGKGITFDTGGLSLKPPVSMIGMKYDMAGAATVFAVIQAVAQLGLPVRVTAWLCLAENMPSGSAIRPGDVLTIRGGRTVEVLNTDAEGRLVLADGLVAASEEHPDAIVDVATLTGAAIVALGNRYVGTFGDDQLVKKVLDCGSASDEMLWHMPMPAELRPLLNSDIADIANVKPGNTAGGMLIAAHFLREFVGTKADSDERVPWVHLDIAGAAQNRESGYGYTPKGPTGVTVRTLIELASRMSAE